MTTKAIDGLPVIDAKRALKLTVTNEDINGADTQDPNNCAIARACRRELHVIEARVHLSRVYIRTNNSNWVRYITPPTARQEIIAFDRGGRMQPCEFKLAPVGAVRKLGGHKGGNINNAHGRLGRGKSGRKHSTPHVIKDVRGGPA